MEFFENLEVVDYLRSGALIIGVFATVFADKKGESTIWLQADALAGAAFGGALYLFPNVLLEYQMNIKSDWLIEHLLRTIGGSLIAMSFLWYSTSGTKDRAVSGVWLLVRTMVGAVTFFLIYIFRQQNLENKAFGFKDQLSTFGLLACGLWTFGNLIHLFRENSFGSVRRNVDIGDCNNTHVVVHLLTVGITCLVAITYPDYIFSLVQFKGISLNALHTLLFLINQAFIMTTSCFPIVSMTFNDVKDKKAFFKSFLWVIVFLLPWEVVNSWKGIFIPTKGARVIQFVFGIAVLNALCAVGCLSRIPGASYVCKILKRK